MAERPRPWIWMIGIGLMVPLAIAIGWSAWRSMQPAPSLRGLRLGSTPSQVRAGWSQSQGTFRSETENDDLTLVWTPVESANDLRSARLEFHLGQLVAMRLVVDSSAPEASGPALEVTPMSVLARDRRVGTVMVTWLSRGCPVHSAEVARRMAGAR